MKLVFLRPIVWNDFKRQLYNVTLPLVARLLGLRAEFPNVHNVADLGTTLSGKCLYFTWHTADPRRNVWNITLAPFDGYIELDSLGYADYSSLARDERVFKMSQMVSLKAANKFFDTFVRHYISANRSKYRQPDSSSSIYTPRSVFVPLQVPIDQVARTVFVKTYRIPCLVYEALRGTGYSLVVKQHPKDNCDLFGDTPAPTSLPHWWLRESGNPYDGFEELKCLIREKKVGVSSDSIHPLIQQSDAVVTANSGVGMEALFHLKPVYVAGRPIYHWIANVLRRETDFLRLRQPFAASRSKEDIVRFVYYLFHNYYVDCSRIECLKKRIHAIVRITSDGSTHGGDRGRFSISCIKGQCRNRAYGPQTANSAISQK